MLTRYGDDSTRVRIPAEIGGIPVKTLYGGEYGVFNGQLDAVQIPESVSYIGRRAFYGASLVSVTIPAAGWDLQRKVGNQSAMATDTIGVHSGFEVIRDFAGVDLIGQGFADELFRVFAAVHRNVKLRPVNCGKNIEAMIRRVGAADAQPLV